MAVTEAFVDAVLKRDTNRVRVMMKNSLLADPNFDEFKAMEDTIQLYGMDPIYVDPYPEQAQRLSVEDRTQWNWDYLNRILYDAVDDFTRVRIEHIKDVIEHVSPPIKKDPSDRKHSEQRDGKEPVSNERPNMNVRIRPSRSPQKRPLPRDLNQGQRAELKRRSQRVLN